MYLSSQSLPRIFVKEDDEKSMQNGKQKKSLQEGALYIEATLSLSFFMFAIFTLLSVIQISYTQARMAVALDCATKELAEYTHVYFATGMAETFNGHGGMSSDLFNKIAEYLGKLGSDASSLDSELGQFITDAGNALQGDSLSSMFQSGTGKYIAKRLMEKNLVRNDNDSLEAFKRRNHIVGEIDMEGSRFLEPEIPEGGSEGTPQLASAGRDVFMQVNYRIQVLKLLNLDIVFDMSHCSYTQAWANGE